MPLVNAHRGVSPGEAESVMEKFLGWIRRNKRAQAAEAERNRNRQVLG